MTSGGDAKTKVTELVLHDTKVKGRGKYNDPWMFVDTYKVTVKSNGNGLIDNAPSATKKVSSFGSVSFTISANSGYKYLSNTCGVSAIVSGSTLTISNVEKDVECNVSFHEEKYSYTLKQPCQKVTTTKYGTRNHCFSNPVPNEFYAFYNLGYYRDSNLQERMGKISIPVLTGWTFDDYHVGSSQLINSIGTFETGYRILNEKVKATNIDFKIHENKYTVTLSHGAGSTARIGTTNITATYDHDLPSPIVVPKKPGYIFEGYFSKPNGQGYKYYNASGKIDSTCEPWNQAKNTEIYAHYSACPVGHSCPTGNDKTICAAGYYQPNTAQTKCIACAAGYYQPNKGQTSCINCTVGSTSTAAATYCTSCTNGRTTSSAGKSTCDAACANRANVTSWYSTKWETNNSVTNLCRASSCSTGYSIVGYDCKDITPPVCTVAKSNIGSQSGVTFSVSCSDNGSGCPASSTFTRTGVKSSPTYVIYDNAGNATTCKMPNGSLLSVNSYHCNPYYCNPYSCNCYSYSYACGSYSCNCQTTCDYRPTETECWTFCGTCTSYCSGTSCSTCYNTCYNVCYN